MLNYVDASFITSELLGSGSQGDGSQHENGFIEFSANAVTTPIEVTDDDGLFQDNDSGQTISDPGASGLPANANVEAEYTVVVQDPNTGIEYTLYGISVGAGFSNVVGFAFLGTAPPVGVNLEVMSTSEGPRGDSAPAYDTLATTICFAPGSKIQTPAGERLVESLAVGDLVITADKGAQPIRWIGRSHISAEQLSLSPELRPVRVKAGSISAGLPAQDLVVSPHHRIVVDGWRAQMLFGEREVLASANSLINDTGIRSETPENGVTYIHIAFDTHEVVISNGIRAESLQPSAPVVDALQGRAREELLTVFPHLRTRELGGLSAPARRILLPHEARSLVVN